MSVTDHDTKLLNSDNRELSIIGFLKKLPTLGILFGSGSLELLIVFIISAIIIYNFMDDFLENKYEKNNRFKNIRNNSIQT